MFSHDREKVVALHVELISMEQKSVDARHALSEHRRGVHMRQARPSRLTPGKMTWEEFVRPYRAR
jgi:hypothetical protein